MLKNNNWKRKEEREISVGELGKKLVKSWKFILCCAFIGAAVFGGYKYYKSVTADVEQKAEQTGQELVTEKEKLTAMEQEAVENAEFLKLLLDGQKAYMEESILMKIDAYKENRIVMQYEINDGGGGAAAKILEQYITYIENGGVVSDILKDGNFDLPAQYLQELIQTDRAESVYDIFIDRPYRYFSVLIIGEDMEMAERLADAVEGVLDVYGRQIFTAPEQSLILLNRQKAVIYDVELEQAKNSLVSNRNNQVGLLNTITSQFSEEQKKAYYKSDYNMIPETPVVDASDTAEPIPIYALAGMIMGAFLGCCWIICNFFLSDKIKSAVELEKNYELCVYGTIKKRGRNRGGNLLDNKQVLARMVLNCHKNKIGKLVFVSGDKLPESIGKEIHTFYKGLEDRGIKCTTIENMLEQVEVYEHMQDTDAVVALLEAEKTTYPMFNKMLGFLADNDVSMLGVIVIEG